MNFDFSILACNKCNVSGVCSVYPLMQSYPQIKRAMSGCRYYAAEEISRNTQALENIDRAEISKKIKELNNDTKDEKEDPVIYQPSGELACDECGARNVQLIECSKCGKRVCADCMFDTMDGRTLCESCYNSEPPEDLNFLDFN